MINASDFFSIQRAIDTCWEGTEHYGQWYATAGGDNIYYLRSDGIVREAVNCQNGPSGWFNSRDELENAIFKWERLYQESQDRDSKSTPINAPKSVSRDRLRQVVATAMLEDRASDNLSIALATYFEKHMDRPTDDEDDPELGWSPWVMQKTEKALDLLTDDIEKLISDR